MKIKADLKSAWVGSHDFARINITCIYFGIYSTWCILSVSVVSDIHVAMTVCLICLQKSV